MPAAARDPVETIAPSPVTFPAASPTVRSLSFEDLAVDYDARFGRASAREQLLADILKPYLHREHPVIDIGTGTGNLAYQLQAKGFVVTGVDLSPRMARIAARRLCSRVVLADAFDLPFRNASAAQLCSIWLTHVVGNPVRVFLEAKRVLRPGGRYVVLPVGVPEAGGDEISDIIESMNDQLSRSGEARLGLAWRTTGENLLLAEAAGFHAAHVGPPAYFSYYQSPMEAAAAVEARLFGSLLRVCGREWHSIVEPTIARLRNLPSPYAPRRRRSGVQAVIELEA